MLIARIAPRLKIAMAAILMITMAVLASALSRTPRTSTQVTAMVISSAGKIIDARWRPGRREHRIRNRSGKMEAEKVIAQILQDTPRNRRRPTCSRPRIRESGPSR